MWDEVYRMKKILVVVVPRPNQSKMSRMDWHISETCDFLQTYGVLLFSHSPDQFRNNTAVTFRIITTHLFVYPLPVKNLSWIHGQKLNDCIFQLRKLQIIFTDLNPLCSIINTEVSVESVFRLPFMTLLTLQMCNNTSIRWG